MTTAVESSAPPEGLRRTRAVALALLVVAAAVFVVARRASEDGPAWIGYVESAAEAAVIGGLADWFAVTALFRHPLGIPIPHTALLRTKKDELGRALAGFVDTNFLDEEVVAARLADQGLADRLTGWLGGPEAPGLVVDQGAAWLANAVDLLDHDLLAAETGEQVVRRLRTVPVAPLAGQGLRAVTEDERLDRLLDHSLVLILNLMEEQRPVFRRRLGEESPWWVPEFVDERVYRRIETGLQAFADDIRDDPDHVFRVELRIRVAALADRLIDGGSEADAVEGWWRELLESPDVRAWAESVWTHGASDLVGALGDPQASLRRRAEDAVGSWADRLAADGDLRQRLDEWIGRAVNRALGAVRAELSALIVTTVERWDADDASRRIEMAVGRDLQFIRINGTVVGAILGLIIHALGELLA